MIATIAVPSAASAQTFTSGSDGSDGPLSITGSPGSTVTFDPTQFHGSQVAANIFNFTTISIAPGVNVLLTGDKISGPVVWLAQGDANIQGNLILRGADGISGTSQPFARVPSIPGAGGFAGGVGGNAVQLPTAGSGPGGGAAGTPTVFGQPGSFSGNQFLIPLVGGSGGGGAEENSSGYAPGGGAGGGAILIASSTLITIAGEIDAQGGTSPNDGITSGGGGSGGAIRLVATTINSNGALLVAGGRGAGAGVVRLECYTLAGSAVGNVSAPLPLLLPTAGPAIAKVISIGGVPINPNPTTFPDITINTTSPVAVVIQTHNVPPTATVNLTILDENGAADTVVQAPPLSNCDQNNFCTTTVSVTFPFGASRGLTRVTWTQ